MVQLGPITPLAQAIKMLDEKNSESIRCFAEVLAEYSDNARWVAIPLNDVRSYEIALFEERGKIYAGMYSGKPSHRFPSVETDINKLLHVIIANNKLDGIVVDPETTQLYLDRGFLMKCLSLCKYKKYEVG